MNLNENIIRIHEMMGIDKPEMVYDYEEGRNTVPDRLPFDVDKLVNAGAVFVTPAIDGNPESKTYMEWLDEPYSHLITLHNLSRANKDSWVHKAVTKKAPTNVWKGNFGEKLYDGKYNQILWSLNKLGINPEDMLVDDSLSNDDQENVNEDILRLKELMGLLVEQVDDKSVVLLDGTSSAGKSYLLKQMNAVPYYESNDPNQWVVIASDDFSGTGEEGREGEERRLKLDHPNIRQWAKEKEDAGIVSGIYRENGETVPENPFENEYIQGTDARLWYVAQEIKTGPWKKIFVDTVDNQLSKYLPNVNFKQILLHTPIYLLVENVSKRNEIAQTDLNFKYDSRDIEMVLKQYLEKYEATKNKPSEKIGDPSTVLTKKGLEGLLSKSTSNKKFIDEFISKLGIIDDGQYYIKVKDNYLSPTTQLINVDSERTVYLDKFKDIVQNQS